IGPVQTLRLEKEVELLVAQDDGGGETLERVYERLEALDAATAEKRAAEILYGLGFNKQMQAKKTHDFSDLEACVWLEETLKKFDRILVVVSHSQDFLNGVCTN
ncbi:hypothetical protein F2P56_011264, partial [Juglans regia]